MRWYEMEYDELREWTVDHLPGCEAYLTPRQIKIVLSWFGVGIPKETLAVIGKRYGVCPSRIRQIIRNSHRKMNLPVERRNPPSPMAR